MKTMIALSLLISGCAVVDWLRTDPDTTEIVDLGRCIWDNRNLCSRESDDYLTCLGNMANKCVIGTEEAMAAKQQPPSEL